MSLNLHLEVLDGPRASRARLDLEQTPTDVTRAALASGDPRRVYFAWLDARVEAARPSWIGPEPHPQWVLDSEGYREHAARWRWVAEHKAAVLRFLADHPSAQWTEW